MITLVCLAHDQGFIGFTEFPFNPILCGIRFIIMQQTVAKLVMDIAGHLCLSCEVMLVYRIEIFINDCSVELMLQKYK